MPSSKRRLLSAVSAAVVAGVVLGVTSPVHAAPDASAGTTAVAATSSVGGAITRDEIVQRAQYWVDEGVPYSQTAKYRDPQGRYYRTDCSGLVSMAWHLSASETTYTLPNVSTRLGDLDDLKPGDILNDVYNHTVLFVGWADAAHTKANLIEHARSGTDARRSSYTRDYIVDNEFRPYRYNKVLESPVSEPDKGMTNITPVGDLTGDGVPDVIAVEASTGDLYRYTGPGYVGMGGRTKIGHAWNGISRIVGAGDLTGDGVADIVAVDADTGELFRYSGPTYHGGTKVRVGVNWDSMTNITAVGDITGDAVPDLIAVEEATGVLYRYAGPGFNGGTRVKIGDGWKIHASLTGVGDITGDGVADIVAVDAKSGELFRYAGPHYNGGTKTKIGVAWDSMTNLTGVGDITGDGVPDLLAVDKATQKLYRYNGPSFNGATREQIGSGW